MSLALINTRPRERAYSILGGDGEYFLPLLELTACSLDHQLIQQFEKLHQVEVIVVVSPMAVEVGMRYLHQLNLQTILQREIAWIAVGEKTAQCLAEYGIVAQTPQLETSEGMFQLPIFQNDIRHVAFWRGHGGREWLMQQLHYHGVAVNNMLLYRRGFPQSSYQQWRDIHTQLTQYQHIAVLISSGESWNNWLHLIQQDGVVYEHITYLVLGQRVFQQIQHEHRAILLENLHDESIRQAMQMIKESL